MADNLDSAPIQEQRLLQLLLLLLLLERLSWMLKWLGLVVVDVASITSG